MEFRKIAENMEFIREVFGEVELQPFSEEKLSQLAYRYYWDYNCEYGVITAFNEEALYPISYNEVKKVSRELPHRWSTICGAITGAFYIFATTLPFEKALEGAKRLIEFHNREKLPIFKGKIPNLPKAAVGSILCRDSIINWCKAAGIHPRSMERAERCACITADIAGKCGELVRELSEELVRD